LKTEEDDNDNGIEPIQVEPGASFTGFIVAA